MHELTADRVGARVVLVQRRTPLAALSARPLLGVARRVIGTAVSLVRPPKDRRRQRVLLVCSPGGHLQQMLALKPAWESFDTSWVTLAGSDVEHILRNQDVVLAHGPTNRSLRKLARNVLLAARVLLRERPDAILSTGAAIAVPFFLLGRIVGARLVYVESLTRTEGLSLSGRLVAPLAHEQFVQWPGAVRGRARYVGSILSEPCTALPAT